MRARHLQVLLLVLMFAGGNAFAAIAVQYTYLDPYGVSKTATPSTPYINPNGSITFALAAGIDRKLEVSLINGLGTVVATARSAVITASDRITVGPDQYYGFFIDLEPPATDGSYTIRARVLAYDDREVYAENYPVIIDRAPPALIGGFGWDSWNPNYLYPMPADTLVSFQSTVKHWVSEVVDVTTGIDASSGRFQSLWLEGPNAGLVAYDQLAVFDPATKQLAIPAGKYTSVNRNVYFPTENGRFLSRFIISDLAGNVATFDLPVRWNSDCDAGAWEYLAIYDPEDVGNMIPGSPFQGYVPYVPGMEVKTNPVKILLRIPRNRWHAYETYGVSVIHPAPNPGGYAAEADFEDANYVYEVITATYRPAGQSLYPENRMNTRTLHSCSFDADAHLRMPNLVLSIYEPPAPNFLSLEMELEQAGVIRKNFSGNRRDKIVRVTATAEPRTYDQTFSAGVYIPGGTCVIPAGETTCDVIGANVIGDAANGMERANQSLYVTSDTGVKSSARSFLIEIDTNVPKVNNVTLTSDGGYADLEMSEVCTGCWSNHVRLKRAWLEASDGSVVTNFDATDLKTIDLNLDWTARVPLGGITGGVYDLRFFTEDMFGNVSAPFEILAVTQDRLPPTVDISVTSGGALNGSEISSMSEIRVTVIDNLDPEPNVTSVRLTGGPLGDDIQLGYRFEGGAYVLEYPVMAPSLNTGDYRLYVTAEDDFGNLRTEAANFDYGPPRFGLDPGNGEDIFIALVDRPLRLPNGNWPLTSGEAVATAAGGMPIVGVSDLTIGLSVDAQGSLNIGGLTLEPGGTITYTGYDFTANDGRLKLATYFPSPEDITEGVFGNLVIQIDRPNTPIFAERIIAWGPANSIAIAQSQPSYARKVEDASFRIENSGSGRCDGAVIAMVEGDVYRNVRQEDGAAICAAKWVSLPPGVVAAPGNRSVVSGRLQTDLDEVALRYQPGMLVKETGNFVFLPVGGEIEHRVPVTEPDVPEISFTVASNKAGQASWLPDGKFPTAIGPFIAGNVVARADFTGVDVAVVNVGTGATVIEQSFSANYGRVPLATDIPAVEGEESFRVEARYTDYPEVAATADISFVALPKAPLIQIARPENPNNISDTVLDGRFGIYVGGAYSFDSASMGDWVIRVYRQHAGGAEAREQIGQDVTTVGSDGVWQANLGHLDTGVYGILAVATYVGVSPSISGDVRSLPTTIKVANGDPVAFSLVATNSTGRPPMTAMVKMLLENSKRTGDVERIAWERSSNGVDFEPIELPDRYSRLFGYGERIETAGEYFYRATSTNRFSGATFTSDPAKIHIYDRPSFKLSGHNNTFSGHPVAWSVVSDNPTRAALYKWSVRRGRHNDPSPLILEGPSQTFDADVNGSWYITVQSRFADAPEVPGAWRKVDAMLKVAPPHMVRPRIVGPSYVEIGQTYEYRVQTYPVTRGDAPPDLYVTGEWELPDGSKQSGETLSYTAQAGDAEIKYTGWVNGFRAETEAQSVISLRQWEYAFPEFRLYRRAVREYDPVQYSYSISQTRSNTGGERPMFQWSFPLGSTVDVRGDVTAIVSASDAGDYPVSVRAYDTRGNEVVLDDAFTVEEPPPLVASLRVLVGDNWSRVPARIAARWYADGLLSSERVSTVRMKLNGAPLSERLLNSYSFDLNSPGQHTIDMEMETTYGRTSAASASFETIRGEVPTCDIVGYGNAVNSLRAQASCQVPMGRIVSYRWWITYTDTGETRDLGLRSAAISLSSAELARGIREIRLVAINDKGQESEPAVWNR